MGKVIGCGIDIEELNRFEKLIPAHPDRSGFISLVYSDDEICSNSNILPHMTFPLAFCCKEAFFKAFGKSWFNSPISWKEIELFFNMPLKDSVDEPLGLLNSHSVRLSGHALELYRCMSCVSYETSLAMTSEYVSFEVLLISE